jgi:hypothetical protein
MRLTSDGNLIVGGTTDGAASSITLQHDGDIRGVLASGAGGDSIVSAISGVSNGYQITVDTSNNQTYKWHNGGTQSMTLDSSGNLLVGTTSTILDAEENEEQGVDIRPEGFVKISRSSNHPLQLARTDAGELIKFRSNEVTVGSIGTAGGALYIGSTTGNDSYLAFYGDVIIPSTSAGLNRDNAIDLGYSSSRFKDLYLSGGVYLGGTGAANKLDDYEEGTWTPALSFDGANVGTTYNSRYGRYTKTGNLVSLSGYFFLSNKGTSTGSARFDNLPFAALSETGNYVSVTFWAASVTNSGSLQGYVALGQTFVQLQEVSGVGTNSNLTQADFANNSEVMIQVSYYTSS